MATKKDQEVARNLLTYRYNHSIKIENAEKLGFTNGAALYPMVTMNGEECQRMGNHFEEIHRNGAIAFAIYNYQIHGYSYILKRFEVLIAIARFWHQRATFSTHKTNMLF
jgi:maltose phosphorylase